MTGMAPMAAASYIRKQSRVLPPLPTGTNLYIHGIILKKSSKWHTAALFFIIAAWWTISIECQAMSTNITATFIPTTAITTATITIIN